MAEIPGSAVDRAGKVGAQARASQIRSGAAGRGVALSRLATTDRAMLALSLLIVLAVQLPALWYFFFNDDYVPFAEIVDNGVPRYIWNLVFVQDITPNWRVVPGLFYLIGYETFGMRALPYHIISLAFHLGTCALLFHVTRRATGLAWAGFLSAILFGINPTHVFTVPQVTSLNNVQGAFFAVATLAAIVEARFDRRRAALWYVGSIVLFVLAIASNESMATLFPVYWLALFAFWPGSNNGDELIERDTFLSRLSQRLDGWPMLRSLSERPIVRRTLYAAVLGLPFAAIGCATLLSFWACQCNEASSGFFGWQNANDLWRIYIGRIAWPIGLERPNHVGEPHQIAAIAVVVVIVIAAIWGSQLARIGALFLVLATIPYIAVWALTAERYTYQATAGFALLVPALVAGLWDRLGPVGRRSLAVVGIPAVALVIGFYSWQTTSQGDAFYDKTEQWRHLVDDVQTSFPPIPPGGRVVIIGGDLTDVIYQFHVMPSIAHLTWNSDVRMYSVPPDSPGAAEALAHQDEWFVARYEGRRLVPIGRAAAAMASSTDTR